MGRIKAVEIRPQISSLTNVQSWPKKLKSTDLNFSTSASLDDQIFYFWSIFTFAIDNNISFEGIKFDRDTSRLHVLKYMNFIE